MKKKILIVEDEFVVANDLEIMLEASGFRTLGIAVSAKAALDKIAKEVPDIVLLDIQLQGTESGIDLARKLKAMHIAYVYLSANSDQTTLQMARATEPYGFIVKPVRSKDLLVTLDIACYRHENSRESYLYRKDRLRRDMTSLLQETSDRTGGFSRLAGPLQMVIPFEFAGFIFSDQGTYSFRGLCRIGFNEYQEIDTEGLMHISAKRRDEIDSLLANVPDSTDFRISEEDDAFVRILYRCYGLRSVIRGGVQLSATSCCVMYVCSREENSYDDRHLSVLGEVRDLMGQLLSGLHREHAKGSMSAGKDLAHPLFEKFIGKSYAISHCLDLVAQVASQHTSVLLTGESGTGKELFADAIHQLSQRSQQTFIKINCAALPYTLIESELFGHEKGAFTGAMATRIGKFEAASGGTIFLDEIGEMSLEVQAKLLRVLQEKKIQRIGGHRVFDTDVRVIAATNRNLEQAVAEHKFRLDLYFRLNVFPIHLPPLRERKEDIALLAGFLAQKIARGMGKNYCGISDQMMEALIDYSWPGNVRELENVIERSLIISTPDKPLGLLQPLTNAGGMVDVPEPVAKFNTINDIKLRQEQSERTLIEAALHEAKGRVRGPGGAAEKLDIKPTTLESKLIRLGIRKEDFK